MDSVFDVAKKGFGEGTNELYDRARPSYPSSILNHLYNSIPSSAHARGLRIIEPGSGTGIFTRLLVAPPVEGGYPTWNISNLVSVEPSSGMRNQWQRSLDKLGPQVVQGKDVKAVAGGFDEFGEVKETIGEGEADLIVVAQAYHWCPDHEAAFRNFAKYLAPEGVLAFVWNLESRTRPLSSAVLQMLPEYDQGSPQYYKMWWRKCFDTEAYKEEFDATRTEEKTVEWKTPLTDESYQDRIMSKSYLTEELLNGERRKVFLQKFHDILVKHASDKEFVDEQKGIYNVSYTTDIVLLRKKT